MDEKRQLLDKYYGNPQNICLIQKGLIGKETAFLNQNGMVIRGIKANMPIYLKQNINHYMLSLNSYNIYRSIAYFKDFPMFSWDKNTRRKQYDEWTINKRYLKHVNGYNYYIDFDNKNNDEAYVRQEVSEVSKIFNKKGFAHTLYSSGKGYHLKAQLPTGKETPETALFITKKLVATLGLTTPDMSIYGWQSLIKAPYSVDVNTMNICTPIKPDMFDNFNKRDTRLC